MGLDVLLQILGALEGFPAEITLVWFKRYMHADVRGEVVALDSGSATAAPLAGQVEVVCALAADVTLAHMFLSRGGQLPHPNEDVMSQANT